MTRLAGLAAVLVWAAAGLACRRPPLQAPASGNAKLEELRAILASRNDNDPRLDSDFNALTEDDKSAFRAAYDSMPRERRNERGTIVYLIGRNAATPQDWTFLKEAAGEPPCYSLADCGRSSAGGGEPGDAVTLAYPALVALKSAERALEAGRDQAAARAVLAAGAASRMRAAALLAQRLQRRFPGE